MGANIMNEKNQGVAWNDSYRFGNEQVDLQHKKIFELASGLLKACLEGKDTAKLRLTLSFLVNYTIQHFLFEEELQVKYNYPEYDRHKQLHEDFKQTVGELVGRFNQNGSSDELSGDVNRIVARWLVDHILREDKKIGQHIQKVSGR